MTILVIGNREEEKECRQKFGMEHIYVLATNHVDAKIGLTLADVIFDFLITENPKQLKIYESKLKASIFLDTTFISLAELFYQTSVLSENLFFGFCGMPTFLNRPLLEISLKEEESKKTLKEICDKLATEICVVADRVGLVTPRIICMIINEAYYTVQEGTATRADIDLAMKLGTNYPFGPFEWCERVGARNVYNLLSAVYEDTKDERYKICSLLKKEFLTTQR